ncbi:MAG: DUF5684 domain-containing protein [Victivallales bacterium]|jgi:hypothetical protein
MKYFGKMFATALVLSWTTVLSAQDVNIGGSDIVLFLVACLPSFAFMAFITAFIIVGTWKMFEKAGKPGWTSIIPIYNVIVLMEIAKKPIWWIVFFFFPPTAVVMVIILGIAMAKVFGRGIIFAMGAVLLPFIFYPILGFDKSKYHG